ncbi:prolipoprotein diacylglyceryl transferase [soil metagenome]
MTTTLLASFPSPAQGVWHLGPVPIRAYALFIIIGIVAALVIGDRRWEARGGERGVIYDIALWAVPFGLIGGRVYHVMTDWQTYFGANGSGPIAALKIWEGGLGIWGAVALGGVGAWIGCKRRGIPLPAFGDAIAPGIVLAQAIGRLGNYFNQELYGRVTDVPWGMEIFYRQDPSGLVDVQSLNGVSTGEVAAVVHPTFLYELLWNLLVFAALLYVDRRFKIGHGRLFALYVAGYCVGRFGVELMRDDFATHIAGIRINSFTSTFVFIGAIVYVILAPKGREDPETLRGTYADDSSRVDDSSKAAEVADELVAAAARTGVVAATAVAVREDDPESEPDSEPEPEPEAPTDAADPDEATDVTDGDESTDVTAATDADEATAADESTAADVTESTESTDADVTESTDADDAAEVEDSPEDEAIVEAEATAGGELFVETAAEAEEAQLIDEDHDPVDEEDLESLQDEVAVVGVDGPTSEQQEEIDADEEAQPKVVSDLQAEAEQDSAEGVADVDETATDAESDDAEGDDAESDEAAVDQEAEPDLEAEVLTTGVLADEAAEAEAADLIDEDHDPVDEQDLESLEAEVEAAAPVSEQQEELAEELEVEPKADSDTQAEAEQNAAQGVADVDETAAEPESEPLRDEAEVLAGVGLVDETDETDEPDATDEPAPGEAQAETPPPPPRRSWPTTPAPKEPTSRLGKLLRRRRN